MNVRELTAALQEVGYPEVEVVVLGPKTAENAPHWVAFESDEHAIQLDAEGRVFETSNFVVILA